MMSSYHERNSPFLLFIVISSQNFYQGVLIGGKQLNQSQLAVRIIHGTYTSALCRCQSKVRLNFTSWTFIALFDSIRYCQHMVCRSLKMPCYCKPHGINRLYNMKPIVSLTVFYQIKSYCTSVDAAGPTESAPSGFQAFLLFHIIRTLLQAVTLKKYCFININLSCAMNSTTSYIKQEIFKYYFLNIFSRHDK